MKKYDTKNLPLGISALRIFYLINAGMLLITTLMFYEYLNILVLGSLISSIDIFIIILLSGCPLYLFFRIPYLKKDSLFLAVAYHIFFAANGILTTFCLAKHSKFIRPLLEITVKKEYKVEKIIDVFGPPIQSYLIQILATAVSVYIITYLLTKRNLFK